MFTVRDHIDAYLAARADRIPVARQGALERSGRFLLLSAARTRDGEVSTSVALRLALHAAELEAVQHLGLCFLPEREAHRAADELPPAVGEFEAK